MKLTSVHLDGQGLRRRADGDVYKPDVLIIAQRAVPSRHYERSRTMMPLEPTIRWSNAGDDEQKER